jgi:excisionase family DNA binding protein
MATYVTEDRLVSAREAAHLLGVGNTTLYKFCRLGRLNPVKFGRRCTRFRLSEIKRLIRGTDQTEVV